MSNSSGPILHLITAVLLLSSAAATDHIVGANKGWNPGINYTFWANNQTFYVGDLISFRYRKKEYNVFEVNETGYEDCSIAGAVGNWSSGKDFIALNEAKRYYFICGTGGCLNGMKVTVLVHELPPPPTPSMAAEKVSSGAARVTRWGEFGVLIMGWLFVFPNLV